MKRVLLSAGAIAAVVLVAACGSSTSPTVHIDGSTAAWYKGTVVQLDYTHDFECDNPPPAVSASKCEVGAPAQTVPGGGSPPPIYVMVPLFSPEPDPATLQCPNSGNCVDHPADLDLSTNLSAVFGSMAGQTPLPPHSHIIDDLAGDANIPWTVFVVGILDAPTWDTIVSGQSLATVATLQASDPTLNLAGSGGVGTHITAAIPSNVYLFFKAHS